MLAEAVAKSPQDPRCGCFSGKAESLGQTRAQSGNPSGSGKQLQMWLFSGQVGLKN